MSSNVIVVPVSDEKEQLRLNLYSDTIVNITSQLAEGDANLAFSIAGWMIVKLVLRAAEKDKEQECLETFFQGVREQFKCNQPRRSPLSSRELQKLN